MRTMSTSAGRSASKSDFVRDQIQKNSAITAREVLDAWTASGNEGTLSETLFYNVKKALGLAGTARPSTAGGGGPSSKGRTRMKKTPKSGRTRPARSIGQASAGAPAGSRSDQRGRTFDELESKIDDMIFQLKTIGGHPDVEEALRKARRLLGRTHLA